MFQHAFTDYLVQLQQVNQRWWKEVEQSKAAVNSPLNKAMQEVNLEDSLKFFEQAANQPAALLKV
ncbi:TPA: class I poly(R)-hydroxyalkanoic acid synthase, partial [Vibrio cholerae]